MPKLDRYNKKKNEQAKESIKDKTSKKNIVLSYKAIEGFCSMCMYRLRYTSNTFVKFSSSIEIPKKRLFFR